jgi:hypothetical protein
LAPLVEPVVPPAVDEPVVAVVDVTSLAPAPAGLAAVPPVEGADDVVVPPEPEVTPLAPAPAGAAPVAARPLVALGQEVVVEELLFLSLPQAVAIRTAAVKRTDSGARRERGMVFPSSASPASCPFPAGSNTRP